MQRLEAMPIHLRGGKRVSFAQTAKGYAQRGGACPSCFKSLDPASRGRSIHIAMRGVLTDNNPDRWHAA